MLKRIFGILFLFPIFFSQYCGATHQVGGYISFKCLHGLTYQVTIVDYTNTYATSADRDFMILCYGDGRYDSLQRLNGPKDTYNYPGGVPLCNYDGANPLFGARKINIYQGVHTYPGPGTYIASMEDPDRMASIANMLGSVTVVFYLQSKLIINPLSGDSVVSPIITNPPVCINGCTNQCFIYNPGAYSPDGDSLSYSLGVSLQTTGAVDCPGGGIECTGYTSYNAKVDHVTGTLEWCSPPSAGIYNFVILITSLRRVYVLGVRQIYPVDTVELELETNIITCSDTPPRVTPIDTCVVANSHVAFTVESTAPPNNFPTLFVSASGLPFSLSPSATFQSTGNDPVNSAFNWNTNCPEVREQPYQVTVKAYFDIIDLNVPPDTQFVAGIGTSFITIAGPAPPHLDATVDGTTVCLHWGPSACTQIEGYNIYRYLGCSPWKHSACETGVPTSTLYKLIGQTKGLYDTNFCDSNGGKGLSPGVQYGYVVDAYYPLYDSLYPLSDGAQSYASNDTCVIINLTVPLILNVSVTKTDLTHGEMFVRWMRPLDDTADLDTAKFPPPYKYVLERATGMSSLNFTTIKTLQSRYFRPLLDTTYMDIGLNTQQNSYNYKVDFYDSINGSWKLIGTSGTASSIYLGLRRGDHLMTLNWNAIVPWNNDTFYIYRQLPGGNVYNYLNKTTNTTYTDSSLTNNLQYCYYIESYSEYTAAPKVYHPLFDSSETICGIPVDTIPPCPPPLQVIAKCTLFEDSLIWNNPERLCPLANKVVKYEIFYTPVENGDMSVITTYSNPEDTVFVNSNLASVAGCYAVIAVDSAGQSSTFNTICVDNCPLYTLPNVFTPNGDGFNNLFTPLLPYRYVQSVELSILNRWGEEVFHTVDPKINWNGNNEHTNQPCPDGIYYYVGTVNEIRVEGIKPIPLHGYVEISRGK